MKHHLTALETAAEVREYIRALSSLPTWDAPSLRISTSRAFDHVEAYLASEPGLVKFDAHDDNSSWKGQSILGRGSFGMAGLWERLSPEGEVLEELVIKQETPMEHEPTWNESSEAFTHAQSSHEASSMRVPTVVHFKGVRDYGKEGLRRYYLEHCPYGSLEEIIYRYRLWRQFLPESFVWHVFRSLARALVVLEGGRFVPSHATQHIISSISAEDRPDYYIVHLDFKPANVFLGKEFLIPEDGALNEAATRDGIGYFPQPKLGDFGLAFVTHSQDREGSDERRGHGTLVYFANEQFRANDRNKFPESRLESEYRNPDRVVYSPQTDIWALGLSMVELMGLRTIDDVRGLGTWCDDEGHVVQDEDISPKGAGYSCELVRLVKSCCRITASLRPEPREILTCIEDSWAQVEKEMQSRESSAIEPHSTDLLYYKKPTDIHEMTPGIHMLDEWGYRPRREVYNKGTLSHPKYNWDSKQLLWLLDTQEPQYEGFMKKLAAARARGIFTSSEHSESSGSSGISGTSDPMSIASLPGPSNCLVDVDAARRFLQEQGIHIAVPTDDEERRQVLEYANDLIRPGQLGRGPQWTPNNQAMDWEPTNRPTGIRGQAMRIKQSVLGLLDKTPIKKKGQVAAKNKLAGVGAVPGKANSRRRKGWAPIARPVRRKM